MQERDSFQLTYSQSHKSKTALPPPEESEPLSPNKHSMLQTFKLNIQQVQYHPEEVISSLTSVEHSQPSLPCPPQGES